MGAYKSAHTQCEKSLPFWSWGEDRRGFECFGRREAYERYLQECLKKLGAAGPSSFLAAVVSQVTLIADYTNNVRDARCWGSDCGNKAAVAFHPPLGQNSKAFKRLCERGSRRSTAGTDATWPQRKVSATGGSCRRILIVSPAARAPSKPRSREPALRLGQRCLVKAANGSWRQGCEHGCDT